ncbi:MAG: Succinyl-CoA ligase (ADP-forming) subunit alpha [Methanosaeta sp. PtaB.Bin039]|nr:MAG: Succinyl-CoA ligase (ADP-forming) subunit alpha [Methanosaeta sp. PtaB.Bin039]OPY44314.1 MAG: Succinyl-CoA ligase (ADP-forming) subunit alpha [Methanosaeta sp. PtaU1.Bin028]HOT06518.1 citrate/2-methylcitrate synthase [Methanotrichaceae archaeon]HQF15609.1 citrate/2-methylcitrate synthase [Methanotrichaceae archaeon]HQI90345.1 citrate/2-methylcitrate synthase [Methanotrichaceae archaeon]
MSQKRPDYLLFDRNTMAFVYGYQTNAIQRMLDFDYVCKRDQPSVSAIINPTRAGIHKAFWGTGEILLPMYKTISDAVARHPEADVMVNFASHRSAFETTMDALNQPSIKTVAVIAEGVPERQARIMAASAKKAGKVIIGPATVGGMVAGAFKIGNTAGTTENIIASRLYRPGCVGFVSKSGGMLNEAFNIISRNSNGIREGIATGGDRYPGSTMLDHIMRYEANLDIAMIACLGELGGEDEYQIIKALKEGKISKPLVAWVTGTCASFLPGSVQFGHAGAKADTAMETAAAKNQAFRDAGANVPDSFDGYGDQIKMVYDRLVAEGKVKQAAEPEAPKIPADYSKALSTGLIRRPTTFICTISDDRGEELLYAGKPITEVMDSRIGIGGVIGLLWFKKELPDYAAQFIEIVIQIVADHGPSVSAAHNAIVASCAGKDLVTSLASGLLTIGPRFGGAIDDAAREFKRASDSGLTPEQFVSEMKQKGINIPGIGHRIKSVKNPDKRVQLLIDFARRNFARTDLLNYALQVERLTTAKKGNLILNVDGCIGILFIDLMSSCDTFTKQDIDDVLRYGYLNGLFALGRSIGIIGHVLDQKRQGARLYRHPPEDIAFMLPRWDE